LSAEAEPSLAQAGPTLGLLPTQQLLLDQVPAQPDGDWLALQLHPLELQRWHGLSWPKRRRDWLAGRLCAKSALRRLLPRELAAPSQLLIGSDTLARPCLPGSALYLSISHSRRRAMAVADHSPLGLDTEVHEVVQAQSLQMLVSAEEVAVTVAQLGVSARQARTLIWCLKEARFKCQGSGSFVALAQGWRLLGWSADAQPRWTAQAAWPPAPAGMGWHVSLHANEHEACALVHAQPQSTHS